MSMHAISATSLGRSEFANAAQSQPHLETGVLRTPAGTAAAAEEDRVTLSAPLITDMPDDDVQGLLASTLAGFAQNAGDALSVHAGLDMSRAMRLLDGLDL